MPGVAFHLAWCIIMISIVKDLWVAVEVEKHKAKKLEKERGVNGPVTPSATREVVCGGRGCEGRNLSARSPPDVTRPAASLHASVELLSCP